MLTDPVVDVVRRELRRISPGVRIESEDIRHAIVNEVIKREVLGGEDAEAAKKRIARAASTALRASSNRRVEKGALKELAVADSGAAARPKYRVK